MLSRSSALALVALLSIGCLPQMSAFGSHIGVGPQLEPDHGSARISGPVTSLDINSGIWVTPIQRVLLWCFEYAFRICLHKESVILASPSSVDRLKESHVVVVSRDLF